MRSCLAAIATRVSRFRYVLAIAVVVSCVHAMSPEPDLSGSIPCGDFTCGSGEICEDYIRDGGNGSSDPIDEYSCVTPPANCPLIACSGECPGGDGIDPCCPACLVDVCSPVIGYDGERSLTCYSF